MKTLLLVISLLVSLVSLNGELFVLNTVSQTISRINLDDGTTDNSFSQTGLYPNQLISDGNHLYLTNSGDNNLQKIDLQSGETIALIELEAFSNPYSIAIQSNYAYVSGLMTNKVYKVDLSGETVVAELTVGTSPGNVYIHENELYVINTGFQYPDYLPGSFSIIDLTDFTLSNTVETPLNPQSLIIHNNRQIHLAATGNYDDVTGAIAIYDLNGYELLEELSFSFYVSNLILGPNDRVYLGNAFGAGLAAYDVDSYEIIYDDSNFFSQGGSSLSVWQDNLYVADAGDFMSNSIIRVYNSSEELIATHQTALGAISMAFYSANTNIEQETQFPSASLLEAYPNPFSSQLNLSLHSPDRNLQMINSLSVYNLKGQRIRELNIGDTFNSFWDGKDSNGNRVSSGVYYLRADFSDGRAESKRVTLIR